ncbi:hypothetical protein CPB86DRAFT_813338 [Serendipita vermifera]|nr:hypothetical protein CPB86DRAFT_813338 [Serendipita vermifera]
MIEWAGIALSRIAGNSPFSCTRIETSLFTYSEVTGTTEHTLKGHGLIDIVETITHLLQRPNDKQKPMFAISYPIALPQEQCDMLRKAHQFTQDHCTTFLEECRFNIRGDVDVADCLFLDLTPGQVAAKRVRGRIVDGRWQFEKDDATTLTILGSAEDISLEDVIDKLILPTVPNLVTVRCVAILKPEGVFPNLKSWDLNFYFLNIPVKWLSTADLSYGAARMMEVDFPFNDQTTANLQFSKERLPCGKAILEGLTPTVKGATRIKVMVQFEDFEQTTVTIQELGSSEKTILMLENVDLSTSKPGKVIFEEPKSVVPGNDGVVGELPE